MRKSAPRCLVLVASLASGLLVGGCGRHTVAQGPQSGDEATSSGQAPTQSTPAPSGPTNSAAPSGSLPLAQANIATALVCGDTPALPAGNLAEFQRYVLDPDVFPDALCNDGTPAVIYYRPHTGAQNANKWVINLHGGGSCNSAEECAARWCNCTDTTQCPFTTVPTFFNRLTMTNAGSSQIAAQGFALRGDANHANPYGDYNQIQLDYCSSDTWHGGRRAVEMTTVNPKTNAPVTFTMHFLGARVLDADLAVLRQDGVAALKYTLDGASQFLPDLDNATEVVFTGDSAGGVGVVHHLDRLASQLKSHNTACQGATCPLSVQGLLDAFVGPERSKLDFGAATDPAVRSYADYLLRLTSVPHNIGSQSDASCLLAHAGNEQQCLDESHVLRHHVTTPFFVRVALRDLLVSQIYKDMGLRNPNQTPITTVSFASRLAGELIGFKQLSLYAEEGESMSKEPGVFAPSCVKHDTIHDTVETFDTTLTAPSGDVLNLVDVFANWQNGAGTSHILTQSLTLADTHCP